ncbi:MAG: hypothetical protein WC264_02490 [Candidatus Paceibacterota bacterium]|jgi:hypothetical protein
MLEFFPQHKEEEERLKKGDPKGDKKGRSFRGKPFIPANEIPDPESYQNIEERIDSKPEEIRSEIFIPKDTTKEEFLSGLKDEYLFEKSGQIRKILENQIKKLEEEIKEEENQEKLSNEKMSKEVKFFRRGDVAHVGPDVEEVKNNNSEIKVEKIFDGGDNENEKIKFKHGKKFLQKVGGTYPRFLSASKNFISNTPFLRKKLKKESKDNLKTMPASKKERSERGEIKKVLHDPKNWEEAGKKSDPMDSIE